MRGSSSDFNHETIPLTLTLSPRFNVNGLRDSFAGRGDKSQYTPTPQFIPNKMCLVESERLASLPAG